MNDVAVLLAEPRAQAVRLEVTEYGGLGEEVVRVQRGNELRVLSTASTRSAARSSSQWAACASLYQAYANFLITPERPFGGCAVPKTGVKNLCSMERSRGQLSGWRSGNRSWSSARFGSNCSFGTEGRHRVEVGAPAGNAGPQIFLLIGHLQDPGGTDSNNSNVDSNTTQCE